MDVPFSNVSGGRLTLRGIYKTILHGTEDYCLDFDKYAYSTWRKTDCLFVARSADFMSAFALLVKVIENDEEETLSMRIGLYHAGYRSIGHYNAEMYGCVEKTICIV